MSLHPVTWARHRALAVGAVLTTSLVLVVPSFASAAAPPPDVWASEYGSVGATSTNLGERVITTASAGKLSQSWQLPFGPYRGVAAVGAYVAPAIVAGVVYHAYTGGNSVPGRLVATSARSGKELWSANLPNEGTVSRKYRHGVTVVGSLALIPYDGWQQNGGIVAVSLTKHAVVWSRTRPAATRTGADYMGGQIAVDGGRVYLLGGENIVTAFRISDGAHLWHKAPTGYFDAIAASGGRLYVTSPTSGLTVFDGATGAQRWASDMGSGQPVAAGGRVFVAGGNGVVAFSAAGCAKSPCPPVWNTSISGWAGWSALGSSDGVTVFLTAAVNRSDRSEASRILRLSAATGAIQWSANMAPYAGAPVRLGGTVWVISHADTLIGWSATGTSTKPLRTLVEPDNAMGITQGISGASGTLAVETWPGTLTAYRVPGT